MEILRSFRAYQVRKRIQGPLCKICSLPVRWSIIHRAMATAHCTASTVHTKCCREISLQEIQSTAEFRTLLLKYPRYFQGKSAQVYEFAMSRGEEYAAALFSVDRFTTFWRFPNKGHGYEAIYIYYECLKRDWQTCAAILTKWPSVIAGRPSLAYLKSALQLTNGFSSAALRDELRLPVYTKALRVYAAELRYTPHPACYRFQSIFTKGFAKSIQHYQFSLLAFWCCTVRAKIRQWRKAYTFRPLAPFTPNTEPMSRLIQRSPLCVPNAAEEWQRAVMQQDELAQSTLKSARLWDWLDSQTQDNHTSFLDLCVRSDAWLFLLNDMGAYYCNPESPTLLREYVGTIATCPAMYSRKMQDTLLKILNESALICNTETTEYILAAYHQYCKNDIQFRNILMSHHVVQHIHAQNHQVIETLLDLYMNRDMCVRMSYTWHTNPMSQKLWESEAMQKLYGEIRRDAEAVLRRFVGNVKTVVRSRVARRKLALTEHASAWETLALRWRWWHSQRTCPICMEKGQTLVALHGEARHAICQECRKNVDSCPMCRASLAMDPSSPTWLPRPLLFDSMSEISYGSYDDRDQDYDDHEWYHYD